MEQSAKELARQANAAVGYSSNNPEPVQLRESDAPKDLDMNALHSAMEYISRKT